MKFSEYDTVILITDYKNEGLKKGDIGAILMVYTEPNEAYEVEFVDDDGEVKAQIVLLISLITMVC
ncbi:DUF4926 domain-containing protein [Clostridium beijerinckii]|uniref:DUF4926 domain-containing protein n=1 Tax=Clostridium beijerinckii TaxID=1520 RepID=UPI000809DFE2|nr:DUF4926 domain-containing protein [Clostridium beijerinckii]OCA97843.1 DUF4926 domain-containing protein [Clostridium beijerinckii]